MSLIRKCLALCCGALVLSAAVMTHADPLLKPGQRLVFYGDSITEQRIYTRYVMDYFTMRYPGVKYSFRNAGWSGDTAPGGAARLKRDVLSLKPDVVTIIFGMNDGRYTQFQQANFDAYMKGLKDIVKQLKAAKVKIVLLSPGCVDPDKNEPLRQYYNTTLTKFGQGVKQLAADENLMYYDLNALMNRVQSMAKADDPTFCMIPDSIHPSNAGHAVMAYAVLMALGCTDQPASLHLDASTKKAMPYKCYVTDLSVSANRVSFTRTDKALPAWFDDDTSVIRPYLPLTKDINQYKLAVTGLSEGSWKISVAGKDVGSYTSAQLAAGVNLSEQAGPWKEMGAAVNAISQKHENWYINYWRSACADNSQPVLSNDEMFQVMGNFGSMMNTFDAKRIAATANRTWRWDITKQ